ncbi:MAG: RHS repeat-associated core domain-containing protein [Coriobacteriales bacterium]|nr:RHS repeat-associated core domain-containing protein [Actinomycetes bacterium]
MTEDASRFLAPLLTLGLGERSDGTTWSVMYLPDASERPYAGVFAGSETASPVAFGFVTTDRGDTWELVDTAGLPFALMTYDAYGNPAAAQTAATAASIAEANMLAYAGYCYDDFSGLYYCSQCYYDPVTAQFISKDPAKADGEVSAYQYCGGDPVGKTDPSGE